MERASGDHLEDDQARRRRVGRDAERLQRIGSAQDAYLTLRMIANPAGDAQGILAAAEQLAFGRQRSEEHTSELQSLMRISYAVFCLKKKKQLTTKKNNASTTKNKTN